MCSQTAWNTESNRCFSEKKPYVKYMFSKHIQLCMFLTCTNFTIRRIEHMWMHHRPLQWYWCMLRHSWRSTLFAKARSRRIWSHIYYDVHGKHQRWWFTWPWPRGNSTQEDIWLSFENWLRVQQIIMDSRTFYIAIKLNFVLVWSLMWSWKWKSWYPCTWV